jgi:predicted phosphodiesterase
MTEEQIKKIEAYREENETWLTISHFLRADGLGSASGDTWKKRYSRWKRGKMETPKTETKKVFDTDKFLSTIRKPKSIHNLCEQFGVTYEEITAHIEALGDKGYSISNEGMEIWLDRGAVNTETHKREEWDGRRTIRFLALSDTHLCSKWQQITMLNEAYDDAIEKDCDFAIHCGDVTDGFYQNRPGHIYELFARGYDEQLDYIVAKYPKRTKKDGTLFITKTLSGNHDHTHLKADGANIVKAFARQREDIEFLGDSYCRVWLTPNCPMDMQHPTDGSQYAISYSTQKLIDAMQGGTKPKLYFVGHHHKGLYMVYRNIHTFEVPCMQAQTPFERGMKIFVMVGWWIITLEIEKDGTVASVTPQLVTKYVMLENDY